MLDAGDLEDEGELIELAPGETSLSFLQRIYRSTRQPIARRMRAAIQALPFETPKLAVTANISNEDFARMLDKAIERSGKGEEVRAISAPPRSLSPIGPFPRRKV